VAIKKQNEEDKEAGEELAKVCVILRREVEELKLKNSHV